MIALVCVKRILAGITLIVALAFTCSTASADYTVNACGQYYNENVFSAVLPSGGSVLTAGSACPSSEDAGGFGLESSPSISASKGHRGAWQANAPAGLEIVKASVPNGQITPTQINGGNDWGGGVYWAGGGQEITNSTSGGSWSNFASPYFGFQIVCGASPCKAGTAKDLAALDIVSVALTVRETTPPSLSAPNGLWQTKGWIRGQWPLNFSGSSPSGMCGLSATVNQMPVDGTSSGRDVATWHQCSAPAVSDTINTAAYGQGPMPLYIAGWDAAGETAPYTKTIYVDNSTPTLSLSGPTDAPSTLGTQFVTATAGGSPSGIADIVCSVDDAPAQKYAGATAQVPVSGLGQHTVSCNAFNNAVTPTGVQGESATRTWSLKIGAPTELGAAFVRYVGLRCGKVKVRKTIPGHWVKRHWHHRLVKIKTRPRHKIVTVTKCHPKTKRVRVRVRVPVTRHGKPVKRHGKILYRTRIEHKKVVARPHWASKSTEHVKHGKASTVSGWLGLTDGEALGGVPVQVLAAPDNGQRTFSVAATATTAANGSWTAKLPPGPSRLIEASYGGSAVTESTASAQITELVRAKIKLKSVSPRWVSWGHTIKIKGKLMGGYLPAGGVNVRLRLGREHDKITYGVREHVSGNGRFTTTYTFGAGPARIHRRYWFQLATLPSSDYPYTPAHSRRLYVKVGGHPRAARRHRRHPNRHRHPH